MEWLGVILGSGITLALLGWIGRQIQRLWRRRKAQKEAIDSQQTLHVIPRLPDWYTPRPDLFAELREQILNSRDECGVCLTTALQGRGGHGKTTLVAAVCEDPDVKKRFNGRIYWVTIGRDPQFLDVLGALYRQVAGGEERSFADVKAAVECIVAKLAGHACLVAFDDVWKQNHLSIFKNLPGACTLLVTTRVGTVAENLHPIPVPLMEREESVTMLRRFAESDSVDVNDLAERLLDWPILLQLAGARLRELRKRKSLADSLAEVEAALERHGVTAFDKNKEKDRNAAFENSMNASLEFLGSRKTKLLLQLAIFPEDTEVPVATAAQLWHLLPEEAVEAIESLSALGFVSWNMTTQTFHLHDEIRDYVGKKLGDAWKPHRRLLREWRRPKGFRRLSPFVVSADFLLLPDAYAWQWFSYHAIEAGRGDLLRSVLLDYRWLKAKLEATGIHALIHDCDRLPGDRSIRLLQQALALSAHVLADDKHQLLPQLIGRLGECDDEEIRTLLTQAEKHLVKPWLKPLPGSLDSAGSALLCTLKGHEFGVAAVAVLPDGRIVSGSDDRTLKVWDAETGECSRTLKGHDDWVRAVSVLPDGRIVSGSWDETLKVWDAETGECSRTLKGHDDVNAVSVLPDGRIVSGSDNRTLKVWDAETGECSRTLKGHESAVSAVSVLPDGRIVSGSDDRTLKVWDAETGECSRTLRGHESAVSAVSVLPDGRIVSGSDDRTLKVWDAETGECSRTLKGHDDWVRAVSVLPDGRIVSGSDDKTLKVWDAETGECSRTLKGHDDDVNAVSVLPDGRIVSGSRDCTVRIWDLSADKEIACFRAESSITAIAATENRIIVGDKGRRLYVLEPMNF